MGSLNALSIGPSKVNLRFLHDFYKLCKKARCSALKSSGTWTPIVNIITVILAGPSTASFSVVAHILLWFNTSPPWLGVCREHQQQMCSNLRPQKALKHSEHSKQIANIKCAYTKWIEMAKCYRVAILHHRPSTLHHVDLSNPTPNQDMFAQKWSRPLCFRAAASCRFL